MDVSFLFVYEVHHAEECVLRIAVLEKQHGQETARGRRGKADGNAWPMCHCTLQKRGLALRNDGRAFSKA